MIRKTFGFSIIELAIVLVILGLLVGGILVGRSLIRASELRSIIEDINRFQLAARAFQDKYLARPGDMNNATRFWGEAAVGNACKITDSRALLNPQNTCNGNADGYISDWLTISNEHFRLWQHLANAGLIEGVYSGIEGSTGNSRHAVPGSNVPSGKISNTGYSVESKGTPDPANAYYWAGNAANVLFFGRTQGTINTERPALIPSEAWNIDAKMDDGKPALGKLRSQKNFTNCHTTQIADTSEYRYDMVSVQCQLLLYGFIP